MLSNPFSGAEAGAQCHLVKLDGCHPIAIGSEPFDFAAGAELKTATSSERTFPQKSVSKIVSCQPVLY